MKKIPLNSFITMIHITHHQLRERRQQRQLFELEQLLIQLKKINPSVRIMEQRVSWLHTLEQFKAPTAIWTGTLFKSTQPLVIILLRFPMQHYMRDTITEVVEGVFDSSATVRPSNLDFPMLVMGRMASHRGKSQLWWLTRVHRVILMAIWICLFKHGTQPLVINPLQGKIVLV